MKQFRYELFEPRKLERVTSESGKRLYVTPEGEKYPSVTTALSYLSRKGIAAWRARVGVETANKISSQASRSGTAMHDIAEKYTLGTLDEKAANPIALDRFRQIQPFLDDHVDVINGIELQMYSHTLMAAGTADLLCQYKGKNTVLDFKTSRRPKTKDKITNYFIQAGSYGIMAYEMYGWKPEKIVILMSVQDDEAIVFEEDILPYMKMAKKFFQFYHEGKLV